ncbi:MAG TPA: hypothetical protein VMV77_06155 [Bacteroidales bacterium]|nr:hypothetical protein [Bacteroidales bacterium]
MLIPNYPPRTIVGAGIDSRTIHSSIYPSLSLPSDKDDGDSPYTVQLKDEEFAIDTDGGAFSILLPTGVPGRRLKIINAGTSGNDVTVTPNGTEQLFRGGAGVAFTLHDVEIIDISFFTNQGWL